MLLSESVSLLSWVCISDGEFLVELLELLPER